MARGQVPEFGELIMIVSLQKDWFLSLEERIIAKSVEDLFIYF